MTSAVSLLAGVAPPRLSGRPGLAPFRDGLMKYPLHVARMDLPFTLLRAQNVRDGMNCINPARFGKVRQRPCLDVVERVGVCFRSLSRAIVAVSFGVFTAEDIARFAMAVCNAKTQGSFRAVVPFVFNGLAG